MSEVWALLRRYAPLIDKHIEKHIPRSFNLDALERICGKPRYGYDLHALNEAVAKPLWDLLDRGGKRWRPSLFLTVYEALGGNPEDVLDYAVIPEVIHNGTLIVDDVEDDSEYRRGKPCIHRIYGVDIAINVGNLMYYLPLTILLRDERLDQQKKNRIYEMYIEEMIRLSIGQAMDIAWHRGLSPHVTEEQYMQMCAYKTGTLARFSAKLAAILADVDEEKVESVGRFAEAIGVAFQIQDDILNLVGEPEKYGKEIGGDITEGKRTLMVIHTLEKASPEDKKRLIEILNMHTRDPKLIAEAISIIKKYGSIEYAKEVSKRIMKEAWNEIDGWLPPSKAKEALEALARFLIEREL